MQPFKLNLPNGAQLTGIHNISPCSSSLLKYRPLIVGLHGSTYDCQYFDANAEHSASITSSALGIPFVAIDRPGFGGTTSLPSTPAISSFFQETGSWLHHYTLPALWTEFGVPNECNCIALLCHSLGAMGGIVAAALHSQDTKQNRTSLYPLGGIIVSGIGEQLLPEMKENPVPYDLHHLPTHVTFPLEMKDSLMFRPGTADPGILTKSEQLNSPTPFGEIDSLRTGWVGRWQKEWACFVVAPVMFGIAEHDCFFESGQAHLRECVGAFENSGRVDGSVIKGAPHCMELSYWSQGWYARCFGFAVECAVSLEADKGS